MKFTHYNFKALPVAVGLLFMLNACNDYEIPESPEYVSNIKALAEKSPTGTIDGLRLPSSYNYDKLPQDPRNPLTKEKVELGKMLFHETALSINPKNTIGMSTYSCGSCHHAGAGFQSGKRQGIGDGGIAFGHEGEGRRANPEYAPEDVDVQPLKSPSVLNSAYQTNNLWNGQFGAGNVNVGTEALWAVGTPLEVNSLGYEGVETQAIAGFSVHRLGLNEELFSAEPYKSLLKNAFPLRSFSHSSDDQKKEIIGLAIAAYERSIVADLSPYQRYIGGDEASLTKNEIEGMKLFFDKANCYACHNGPALNSMEFHALGFPDLAGAGIIGEYSEGAAKGRGGFTQKDADNYKFKVPQLYNLEDARFFGHGSSFNSIEEIVRYKNTGQSSNTNVPESQLAEDFVPLNLTEKEVNQLVEFLKNGLRDPDLKRYEPTFLPSGNCFPNNDEMSKKEICY